MTDLPTNKLPRGWKMTVRREVKKLPGLLHDGETVLNMAQGKYDDRQGLVAVTDRRIVFLEEGMTRSRVEDFTYEKISSVQTGKSMMYGTLTIYASGNTAEVKDVMPKERAAEIGDYVRTRLSASPAPAVAAPPTDADTPMSQIAKLGELRDAGVLTDDEFNAKKAELLARL